MSLDFSNDTIEKLLIKKSLTDKKWLDILSSIYDKRWFSNQNYSAILKIVISFYKKYTKIPNVKTIQLLAKKFLEKNKSETLSLTTITECLTDINNLNLNIGEDVISENLKGFIKKSAMLNALFDNAELLEKSTDNYEIVVDKCLSNYEKVNRILFSDVELGMSYFNENDMAKHWEFIKNPETKISTGWVSIDNYTNGGFLKDGKMLAIIMAQAGLGKSVFLSNLAVNFLKQNLKVVVISLEMSEDVYASRFDAHITNTDINKLKENEETVVQKIKKFYEKYPNSGLYIKEYPPRSIKPSDIEMYLENLKNSGKDFDVVIVDYLNLVLPQNSSESMFKDGLNVSEKLRSLSYTFNVPVITAVQANSEGMNNSDIGMENISESRGIAHTGDFISALFQTESDREHGVINMRILKNRLGGKVGKLSSFKLDPETLNLYDIDFIADNDIVEDSEIKNIKNNIKDISDDILELE